VKKETKTVNIGCWPVALGLFAIAIAIAATGGSGWLAWLILAPLWIPIAAFAAFIVLIIGLIVLVAIFGD
jgi:hypothetical protein